MTPVVAITGSASGVGAACTRRFVQEGWIVGALDLAPQAGRDGVVPIEVDITDQTSVREAMRALVERAGRPSACVNAAGIYPRSTVGDFSIEDYRRIFGVNVLGTLLVSQAFVAERRRDGRCTVLNIASEDGFEPPSQQVLYSASKAAVINITSSMAHELESEGVRVNALAPADIATQSLLRLRGGNEDRRSADVTHIADLCWMLAGRQPPPLINGQTIRVGATELDQNSGGV